MADSEKIVKPLGSLQIGDEIIAEGELSDIKDDNGFYNMPCPGSAPGGMSIFGEDEDYTYVKAFCDGHDAEFFTAVEDKIAIKYGGQIELRYRITEESLEEYGVTLGDYKDFVKELVKLGLTVRVTVPVSLRGEDSKDK